MNRVLLSFGLIVGFIIGLTGLKSVLGYGPVLFVATSALFFCIGALWGAGQNEDETHDC